MTGTRSAILVIGMVAAAIGFAGPRPTFAHEFGESNDLPERPERSRLGDVASVGASLPVPEDAVLPEAGSGILKAVGPDKVARIGIRFGAMASIFHDGTQTTAADIVYPYSFAFRWGTRDAAGASATYDSDVDRSTALLRRRLAGVRLAGVDKSSKTIRIGEFEFVRKMLLVDVYMNDTTNDPKAAAVIAPPWSSVPWHVLALMEEAVWRGWAAFSKGQAARLSVPWLDLARSPALNEKLAALVEEFRLRNFVPQPLVDMVTAEEAGKRWTALKAFFGKHGHFMVTNGPYRLGKWSAEATTLTVFRDQSYPLGVGSYDSYAIPRRAHVTKIEPTKMGLRIAFEIETVEKFMRSFEIVRVPITDAEAEALKGQTVKCRYVVVADDGAVRLAGSGRLGKDGTFAIDLEGKLPAGAYTVLASLVLNGNSMNAEIRNIPYRVRTGP